MSSVHSHIIKRPVLTEKTNRMKDVAAAEGEGDETSKKVVFQVSRDANKHEIRDAVEKLFNVTVTAVRTQIVRGKWRRVGKFEGKRPHWKKAIVTLKPGDSIEFFEGV